MLKSLFSVPIYRTKVYIDSVGVKEGLLKTPVERREEGNCFASKNGFVLNNDSYKNFKLAILDKVYKLFFQELLIEDEITPIITNSWIIKHTINDYASSHMHFNSFFSGVYYLKCDQNSGYLVFENPLSSANTMSLSSIPLNFKYKDFNEFNSSSWSFLPEESDLFLFPSGLKHSVTKCLSEERISLAFNVGISGKLNNQLSFFTINMS